MLRKALYPAIVMILSTIPSLPGSDCHAFLIWFSDSGEESSSGSGSGSGQPDQLCDQYPLSSQKRFICDSYDEDRTKKLETLPIKSSGLEKDVLYIVTNPANTLSTPYSIPAGAAIIPHPDTTILDISLTEKGTGSGCGVCGISLSEGSMVAGLSIDAVQWNPKTIPGKRISVVYSATTESLFAESVLWGATGFDDLVYQNVLVAEGEHPTLDTLRLYPDGASNALTVESSSEDAVSSPSSDSGLVHISNLVVTLGGSIADKHGVQTGINLINVNPAIRNAQILFEPVAATDTFNRRGIAAEDTPLMMITGITFAVTEAGFRRDLDVQEYYTNDRQDHLKVFSGPNHYINELKGQPVINPYEIDTAGETTLEYILVGDSKSARDVDIQTNISFIDTFTRGGGSYPASALQLNGTCDILANGSYSPDNPFPLTTRFGAMVGPTNATVLTYTQACAFKNGNDDCSTYEKWKWGIIGAATATGITVLTASSFLFCIWCIKRCASKSNGDYHRINGSPNFPQQ